MKIAIFHNFMDNIGGAEMVTLTLARELNADIYSTSIDTAKIRAMGFHDVKTISLGNVPKNAPFRQQLALYKFRKLNLHNKYDFYIVSGDWAVSGLVNNKPNLWYVHSPLREIWDLYEYTRKKTVPYFARWIYDGWVYYNRRLNKEYIKHASALVCNSLNTQKRIKKYLQRHADIIYPPIETSQFEFKKSGAYWLSVNRLIGHKRVDLQLKAFAHLPNEKLIIVGSYENARHYDQYRSYLNSIKPSNVQILPAVDVAKLRELYSGCKGFITTSLDEDFGMTAVEAMASGKPVIAPAEGGYKETVINNKTGKLLTEMTPHSLTAAIKEIGKNPVKYKSACLRRAKEFDTQVFIQSIKNQIDAALRNNKG